jgi:hypothetical protein
MSTRSARAGEGWGAGNRRKHQLRPGAPGALGSCSESGSIGAEGFGLDVDLVLRRVEDALCITDWPSRSNILCRKSTSSPRLVLAISEAGICSVNMQRQQLANNNMHPPRNQLPTANAHRHPPASAVMCCSSQQPAPSLCANPKQPRFAGAMKRKPSCRCLHPPRGCESWAGP